MRCILVPLAVVSCLLSSCAMLGIGSWGWVRVVDTHGEPIQGVVVRGRAGSVSSENATSGEDGWAKIPWSLWGSGSSWLNVYRNGRIEASLPIVDWPMHVELTPDPWPIVMFHDTWVAKLRGVSTIDELERAIPHSIPRTPRFPDNEELGGLPGEVDSVPTRVIAPDALGNEIYVWTDGDGNVTHWVVQTRMPDGIWQTWRTGRRFQDARADLR
ncbi:MAG: hypothetical protein KDB80_15810 [Planctomycetes bacterium]|nr:hypothetical protein [Planctomycetota bacterium]